MHSIKRFIPASFVVLWATGFIGARYAMPWAEPFTFLAIRFVLAAILFAGLTVLIGSRRATREEALHATVAGVLMHGVYLGGVFWAIHRGMPAGLSALIVGLQPLITAVLAGSVVTILGSLAFETRTITVNGELIFAMAWLVLVLSLGAIFLLMVMIRDGEMSKVASLFYLVPAVTAVIAWALFGEELTLLQIAGMAIATLGVGLATARQDRAQPTRARASR
ncbi:MAG: EamA/RhaT family transporter [Mesorhizobium sp.]|uniref:EamA family transporter n=1 Tax=Mesorhizobium sp. TaxID=1871066 RepID=UPI000FE4DA3B|nr:EamA family transporter [Mesorhizobium sp.]RWG40162.1 MAG: EamA/RhaT family transporter [Mesorhizobium sp.]